MIEIIVSNTAEGVQADAVVHQTNPETNLPTQPDTTLQVGQSGAFYVHATNQVSVRAKFPE